jgi:hypothetical protein
VAVPLGEPDSVCEPDPEGVPVGEPDRVSLAVCEGLCVPVSEGVPVSVPDRVSLAVGESVPLAVPESVGVCVPLSVPLSEGVPDPDGELEGVSDGVGVGDVADGVAGIEGVPVGDTAAGHVSVVITWLAVSTMKVAPSAGECTAPRLPLSWATRSEPYVAPATPVPTIVDTTREGSAMRRRRLLPVSLIKRPPNSSVAMR